MSQYQENQENIYNEGHIDDMDYDDVSNDFSNDAVDNNDLDTDEWADDVDSAYEKETDPPHKKKTSLMKWILILVGAVIVIFGGLVLIGSQESSVPQVDKNNEAVTPSVEVNSSSLQNIQSVQEDERISMTSPEPPAETINQGIMGASSDVVNNLDTSVTMKDTSDILDTETNTVPQPDGKVNELDSVVDLKPVSDFPTVDQIKKPAEITQSTVEDSGEDTTPNTVNNEQRQVNIIQVDTPNDSVLTDMQMRIDQANQKINELQKELQEKASELSQMSARVSDNSGPQVGELEQKIKDLEVKLAETKKVTSSTVNPQNTISGPVASVSNHNNSHLKAFIPNAPVWILKSATVGRAILLNKTTNDMRRVEVGENIQGLGRVRSIQKTSQGWAVIGSESSLFQ